MEIFSFFHQIIFFAVLVLSLLLLTVRFYYGPTNLDRLLLLDSIIMIVLSLASIYGIVLGTEYFIDAILVLSIVGFLTTISFAKFIEKGRLFDDD